jgi:SAM-dependent methyltransferase
MVSVPQDNSPPVTDRHSPTLGRVLEVLESAPRYRDWIFSMAEPYLGDRVLEFGAGSGTMFSCLLDREQAIALELDPGLVQELERRFGSRSNVTVIQGNVNEPAIIDELRALRVDSAMTFNVLEHIEDDQSALRSIGAVLDPGDPLAVLVPAFPSIFGAMDRGVGHVRRYRRRELVTKMEAAGFSVLAAHYVNFPGYFAWFINGRVLRAASPAGGSRLVSLYDNTVIPVTRRLERTVHPPCGQSLFVVGSKR